MVFFLSVLQVLTVSVRSDLRTCVTFRLVIFFLSAIEQSVTVRLFTPLRSSDPSPDRLSSADPCPCRLSGQIDWHVRRSNTLIGAVRSPITRTTPGVNAIRPGFLCWLTDHFHRQHIFWHVRWDACQKPTDRSVIFDRSNLQELPHRSIGFSKPIYSDGNYIWSHDRCHCG